MKNNSRLGLLITGTLISLLTACGQQKNDNEATSKPQNITTDAAVRIAKHKFNAYLPKILKTHEDAKLDLAEVHTGDFTGDGVADVAIYFDLVPIDGGNAVMGQGVSLYQNTGADCKVIAGYEPDYLFSFDTIREGKVYVTKLEYAEGDGHCCPSIKESHTLTISDGKAY